MLGAASMWGLMSPMGKAAMEAGITGLSLATMRMIGGAVCFWIASLFAPKEKVIRLIIDIIVQICKTPENTLVIAVV